MKNTSASSAVCHALLAADPEVTQRIFASAVMSLTSGLPVRVSVQTIDGQYHYLEITTRISTDTANESGG